MSKSTPKENVIPIEMGRTLKKQKPHNQSQGYHQTAAVRRLIRCVEMLAEVSRDIATKN